MPELPEVETVRRGLEPAVVGRTIVAVALRRADLRFPFVADFAVRLSGRGIVALGRRAKYLVMTLDDGSALVMHLGMSGSFRIEHDEGGSAPGRFHHPRSSLDTHDHVVISLSNGTRVIYNDPRRFGFMALMDGDAVEVYPPFARLGIEPLDDGFDAATLARLFAGKVAPLKAVLLDQAIVAGLGNIYVCEALHRSGLSPRRSAGTLVRRDGLPTLRAAKLVAAIRTVLLEAIEAGGSSLRDHRQTDGSLGYFQHSFRVYDREGDPCPDIRCAGIIRRIVQAGRSTFFCPLCQR